MAMQAETKDKWIEALESGDYMQTQGYWGDRELGEYCCLQVLRIGVLGLNSGSGNYEEFEKDVLAAGLSDYGLQRCMDMNDCENRTFPEIAAWVRDNVETVGA